MTSTNDAATRPATSYAGVGGAAKALAALHTQKIFAAHVPDLTQSIGSARFPGAVATLILAVFDDYYARDLAIPHDAKQAFEARNWRASLALSHERLAIYSASQEVLITALRGLGVPALLAPSLWANVVQAYRVAIEGRYERDLALAYFASLRRGMVPSMWEASARIEAKRAPNAQPDFLRTWPVDGQLTEAHVQAFLELPGFNTPFANPERDARDVAERVNQELEIGPGRAITHMDGVAAGFYRNRGAYIIGALSVAGRRQVFALAVLHRDGGPQVDAVILRPTTLSHVFSSTLANFHVPVDAYHDLVDYLHALMPGRPRGQHYSTIGYNHVGKIAVMRHAFERMAVGAERLDHAPGPRGSVAMAFTAPQVPYVFKVIRDAPTDQYKWERYDGRAAVLAKYRRVHELNRSGSMLDNIIYNNVPLPRRWFDPQLLEDLVASAGETVSVRDDDVVCRHLIGQRKLTPVPLFLETCSARDAQFVVVRLGQCIRNNAAINVFNRDLDGRNYGVSSLKFVYLFDYDAVDALTDVKVRTNEGREPGEEDVPDWFFETGTIFLPEELEAHLKLPTRDLRRLFREAHGELLTMAYWERMQGYQREGRVPRIRTYPRATQLRLAQPIADLTLAPLG
ncbi:MAG: isocitrate dehydrogenase kinase/phosphatase AceK regulatory subunit [Pseudomonadota bacterium]